jgi:hypothetical protein
MKKMKFLFLLCLSVFISSYGKAVNFGNGSLELIDFSVVQNLNKIDIRWSTSAVKTGGPYFCIEKSKDGKIFSKVVDMPAVDNLSSYTDYFETDYQPFGGVSYYRIKQVDAAGNFRYSQIVTLKVEEETKVEGYEAVAGVNPEQFREIKAEDDAVLVIIRDKDGNDYYSKASISTAKNVNIINLDAPVSSGTYQVVGSSNEKLHSVNVFVK